MLEFEIKPYISGWLLVLLYIWEGLSTTLTFGHCSQPCPIVSLQYCIWTNIFHSGRKYEDWNNIWQNKRNERKSISLKALKKIRETVHKMVLFLDISYSDIWQSSKRIEYQKWKEHWYEKATEWENRRENVRKGEKKFKKADKSKFQRKYKFQRKLWITGHKDLNSWKLKLQKKYLKIILWMWKVIKKLEILRDYKIDKEESEREANYW